MNDDDKLTQILQALSELKVEVSHLNQRLSNKSDEIKNHEERIKNLEVKLALNDQKTNKADYWTKVVMGGIITILLGYVAIKLGLK